MLLVCRRGEGGEEGEEGKGEGRVSDPGLMAVKWGE